MKLSRAKAVRMKCLDCCCGNAAAGSEVRYKNVPFMGVPDGVGVSMWNYPR